MKRGYRWSGAHWRMRYRSVIRGVIKTADEVCLMEVVPCGLPDILTSSLLKTSHREKNLSTARLAVRSPGMPEVSGRRCSADVRVATAAAKATARRHGAAIILGGSPTTAPAPAPRSGRSLAARAATNAQQSIAAVYSHRSSRSSGGSLIALCAYGGMFDSTTSHVL